MKTKLVLASVFMGLLLIVPAFAQTDTGTVKIFVTYQGLPYHGALVNLQVNGQDFGGKLTNKNGYATFKDVPCIGTLNWTVTLAFWNQYGSIQAPRPANSTLVIPVAF